MADIAIIVDGKNLFAERGYFLHAMAGVWQGEGLDVAILEGSRARAAAAVAILHVDLTRVPGYYRRYASQFPVVLNQSVLDISKRSFSAQLVRPGDGYEGPVIVKTNLNCGGGRERERAESRWWGRPLRYLRRHLHGSPSPARLKPHQYPIYESPAQVPDHTWRDRGLVIERFLSERQGDLYCLRTWVFLGDAETSSICTAREPIVKSRNMISRVALDGVPDDLREMRRKLRFDYGKFDYAIVDGRTVLYDVNRTPSMRRFSREEAMPRIRQIAKGIHQYL